MIEHIGLENYDELTLRANKPRKYTKADKKERLDHFKAQRKYLKRRRADGEQGYIEFVEWD